MFDMTPTQLQKRARIGIVLGIAALLVLPFVTDSSAVIRMLTFTFIWAGFAIAWNLFSGFSGYISFGHAIFFGTGAFTSMYMVNVWDISPWIGMIVGGVMAGLMGLLIGFITLRALSGIYFALSILAITLIAEPLVIWLGYVEISLPFDPTREFYYMGFRDLTPYYLTAFALMVVTFIVSWKVKNSKMGYYLNAIKGSEPAARSLGVNAYRIEIYALGISGLLSGLFGTVYMQTNFIFTAESAFGLHTLVQPVVLSIAGGLGTLFGPVVGAFLLFPFAEMLRAEFGGVIPGIHNVIYGIVLIIIIIYLPDGILPGVQNFVERRFVSTQDDGIDPDRLEATEEVDQ